MGNTSMAFDVRNARRYLEEAEIALNKAVDKLSEAGVDDNWRDRIKRIVRSVQLRNEELAQLVTYLYSQE